MLSFRFLAEDEWRVLRRMRLAALQDSPNSFLSKYHQELEYGEGEWRRELSRGDWLVGISGNQPVALLGAAPEADIAMNERYLSYLWVGPAIRRSGVASGLVAKMLDRLRSSGIQRAWLWVLDGNEPAWRLYESLGFISTRERQPLPDDPSRSEERLTRELN